MAPMSATFWAVVAAVLAVGCGAQADPPTPSDGPARTEASSQLRPASELTRHCHGWPGRRWSRSNHATLQTQLRTGDPAIDFTLKDSDGQPVRLADLLKDKPVLLHSGSFTCPRFQDNQAGLNRTAERFADRIHTAVVYVTEAHPKAPQPSAYHGVPKPQAHSDRRHSASWTERANSARELQLQPGILRLVDDLDGANSNPFWCSYGTCPSCSFLVGKDGRLRAVHLWHDEASMNGSIEALLAEN